MKGGRYVQPGEEPLLQEGIDARNRIRPYLDDKEHWLLVFPKFRPAYMAIIAALLGHSDAIDPVEPLRNAVFVKREFDGYDGIESLLVLPVPKADLPRERLTRIAMDFGAPPGTSPSDEQDILGMGKSLRPSDFYAFVHWLELEQQIFSMN